MVFCLFVLFVFKPSGFLETMSGFQSTSLCRVPAGAKRPGLRGAGGGQRPAGDPPHFSEVGCRVAHKQVGAQASPTLLDGALAPLYPHLLIHPTHPCPLLCVGSKLRISFLKIRVNI